MVPPAPARFSTISGWPLANCAKPFDRLRDSVSAAPPAPTVTRRRTGRSGHCAADWAKAGPPANATTATAVAPRICRRARLANDMANSPQLPKFVASLVTTGGCRRNAVAAMANAAGRRHSRGGDLALLLFDP